MTNYTEPQNRQAEHRKESGNQERVRPFKNSACFVNTLMIIKHLYNLSQVKVPFHQLRR